MTLSRGIGNIYDFGNSEFKLRASMGLIKGVSVVDKFGSIDSTPITPATIWTFGSTVGEYTYDDNADIISISSDNALDTQPIVIRGLDNDGNEVSQTITLQGQTRVSLTTPLWRVFRAENDADFGNTINGTGYVYTGTTETAGTPPNANVRLTMDDRNQTLMSLYTVPLGKVGFLYRGELGATRSVSSGDAQCAYYSRRLNKEFLIKKELDLSVTGTSIYKDNRSFPDIIPALTDIQLKVNESRNSSIGLFGTFDIFLVDEDLIPDLTLQQIGQPTSRL